MPDIDAQHKYFIGIINQSYNFCEKNSKEEQKILDDLVSYARIHFTTEEAYFERWNYPFKEEHIREHEKILLKVMKYYDYFSKGKGDCRDFLNFLRDWLENHLKVYDMKYAKYFKEKKYI